MANGKSVTVIIMHELLHNYVLDVLDVHDPLIDMNVPDYGFGVECCVNCGFTLFHGVPIV